MRVHLAKTNSMGDLADVGRMANNLMQGVIVKGPYLQLVESARLDELLAQQKHQQVFVRSEEATRAAQLSGAKWLILPDLLQADGIYQFSIRIVGIETSIIPAIAQESFQDRKEILARVVSCTEKLLQQFAQQQGIPPILASAPAPQVQPQLEAPPAAMPGSSPEPAPSPATKKSDRALPSVKAVKSTDSVQNAPDWSPHFLFRVGFGFNNLFQPSESNSTRTMTITPAVQLGVTRTIGDYAFFAPYLRYRLNWGVLVNSVSLPYSAQTDEDSNFEQTKWSKISPIAHQFALGFSLGGASPQALQIFHAFMAGVGVDLYLRKTFLAGMLCSQKTQVMFSPYIGYEISGKSVGGALELGLGIDGNGNLNPMIDFAFVFGWAPHPRKAI